MFFNIPQIQYKNPWVQIMMFKNMTPSPFLRFYLGECGASLLWSRTVFSSICSSYCSSQVIWGTGSCKLILLLSPWLPIRWHTVAIVIWTLLVSSCPHMSYTTQASFSKFPCHTLLWCLHSCQFLCQNPISIFFAYYYLFKILQYSAWAPLLPRNLPCTLRLALPHPQSPS